MTQVRIVIFAKAPLPGLAKTRLIPALGPDGSAQLAKSMLEYTLANALEANVGPVELCITPDSQHAIWNELDIPDSIECTEQGEGNLGDRMGRRSQALIDKGEALLLIGTDCPQLDSQLIKNAAQTLKDHDSCLIPASDGGYVLLGIKKYLPALFKDMPWSTPQLADLTLQQMKIANWRVKVFAKLHDIDEPEDLIHLPPCLQIP